MLFNLAKPFETIGLCLKSENIEPSQRIVAYLSIFSLIVDSCMGSLLVMHLPSMYRDQLLRGELGFQLRSG